MAETLLAFGVEKLWDLLARESERLQGFDEPLTDLKSDLDLLRSFLKDADAKKHANDTVRNCVEKIKEIVLDAEDVIETFLLKEELGGTSGIRKRMRSLACITVDRRQLAIDMEGISKRISKVIHDMQGFGVQHIIADVTGYSHPLQERQREMRHTFPSENEKESDFVGLEKNVKKLVAYLVEEDSIQVVSIAGMGGIGKTTLARQVFNHEMVKTHFDGAVWVCVSQQFTRKYVWETILQRLITSKHDEGRDLTEDELQEKLFRLLETNKTLIVLDDMWKEEDWDIIKAVFPPTKGWKVLFTSRNEGVALHADSKCVTFKPECLTSEESWMLFQKITFPKKDTTEFKVEEMEEIGKQMIKHCGGLPLAVRVLGGLLATKYTLHEWKRIYENIRSHIVGGTSVNDKNISSVYHVLYLSFEELPIYLKQCFLYLAHFPEDYEIDVEKLSYYLAAEGIPRPRYYDGATIREVADGYIEELVKINMVIAEKDIKTSRFETCQLHDMMREVCLLKAEEENFLQIIVDDASNANSKSPCRSRRLVVHWFDVTSHIEREMKNPKLRSLLLIKGFMRDVPSSWFTRVQLMRILDLSRAKFKGGKLPSSIGKLIHLRYLSLYLVEVSQLPSSMRNLKQLLYLNLRLSSISPGHPVYMPDFLKEMQNLRYLCLPMDIHNKVKLELGNLIKLETLKNFSTKASNVRDLQGMTRLRVLSVDITSECNVETLYSFLSEMRHLEELTIDGGYIKNTREFVLDCVHLRKLRLSIHMQRLPDEHHFPSQLTFITLYECRLEEDPMPILEKLLQLKEVHLIDGSFSGRRMVCSGGGFPQLRELILARLEEWEEWIVEEGSMPLLYGLDIFECKKVKGAS